MYTLYYIFRMRFVNYKFLEFAEKFDIYNAQSRIKKINKNTIIFD